jgi:hypothetical protein
MQRAARASAELIRPGNNPGSHHRIPIRGRSGIHRPSLRRCCLDHRTGISCGRRALWSGQSKDQAAPGCPSVPSHQHRQLCGRRDGHFRPSPLAVAEANRPGSRVIGVIAFIAKAPETQRVLRRRHDGGVADDGASAKPQTRSSDRRLPGRPADRRDRRWEHDHIRQEGSATIWGGSANTAGFTNLQPPSASATAAAGLLLRACDQTERQSRSQFPGGDKPAVSASSGLRLF